jgi:hypothetical protein
MKSVTLLLKSILPLLLVLVTAQASWAQFPLPVCSGNGAGKVYFSDATTAEIFIIDPSKPMNSNPANGPLNPIGTGITMPLGATALAVGTNYGTGPNPTYFTTAVAGSLKYLYYYNGVSFISTGVVFPQSVDNITGSCGAIYGIDCSSQFVWRWAGGTSTTVPLISTGVGNIGSCDIAGDCAGNFWVINQSGTPATARRYNQSGTLLTTYTLTGTYAAGGGGFAVNGGLMYYDGADGELYTGVINNATNTVNFSKTTTSTPFVTNPVGDFASCGYEGACLGRGDLDSVGYCGDTARVTLRATGPGPYNWTVVSGPGVLTNVTGNQATVVATAPTLVTYMDADCAGANTIQDTTVIFVTKATVFAGNDTTLIGCRMYFYDTLDAQVTDTTPGVIYAYDWTPLDGTIISGQTTLQPIISPTGTPVCKYYTLTVTAINGCQFKDSIKVCVADSTPKANFTWKLNLGCDEDTVRFINLTPTKSIRLHGLMDFDDTVNNNGNRITSYGVSRDTHL